MEVILHTAGDKDLTTMDIMECIIELKADRKKSFCSAYNYPFLKVEGWYVIVSEGVNVVHLEHFNFDDEKHEIKFNKRPQGQPGSYALTIRLMSDCYIGLDIEKEIKYEIQQAKKEKAKEEKDEN